MTKYQWVLLLVFFAMWLYTEFTEYNERDAFYQEVSNFMYKGERFTADDGRALKARIEKLESEIEQPAD
jgi:hypothetical protein